ncbi:amidase [Phenylobacterium aquaticum]|uniref:amidase n=1 Tax=Phenylobacterium aquaticum TaxID=1763816 RepID=UPI0026ECA5B6|nr:amidase [Phenylobacterium aquaticum]
MDIENLDAMGCAELIAAGQISPRELVQATIDRIEALNPSLNAVVHKLYDKALAAAEAPGLADTPLRGVPTLVKDLDGSTAGDPWYGGSVYLKKLDWHEPDDSHAIAQMRRAGLLIVGKTATPELGMQVNTVTDAHGTTRNPWNLEHSAGGSSGGSGAAVAARIVPVAHGGDGGGSIRIPAGYNGLFGLKPSRGRVSNAPLEADPWGGLVCRHVLTRSVRDSALLLDWLSKPGVGDPYAAPAAARAYLDEVRAGVRGLKVGLMTHHPLGGALDPECVAAVRLMGQRLAEAGCVVEEASPPAFANLRPEWLGVVVTAWIAHELEDLIRRTGVEPGPGDLMPAAAGALAAGRKLPAPVYIATMEAIHAWSRTMKAWWADHDILLMPTSPYVAPRLDVLAADPGNAAMGVSLTAPFNMTGQPAASIPGGWSALGLPIGVQAIADFGREDLIFRIAGALEDMAPWTDRKPGVCAG